MAAGMLVLLGAAMLLRGVSYALQAGLGWQGMLQAAFVAALVIGLGVARWRYWQQKSR
jgi:hypothetical protein